MSEFPTGKPHISYSEVRVWKECAWRHKLAYIDKLDVFEANVYSDFGSTVHEAIELYLKTKTVSVELCNKNLAILWKKREYDSPENIKKQT